MYFISSLTMVIESRLFNRFGRPLDGKMFVDRVRDGHGPVHTSLRAGLPRLLHERRSSRTCLYFSFHFNFFLSVPFFPIYSHFFTFCLVHFAGFQRFPHTAIDMNKIRHYETCRAAIKIDTANNFTYFIWPSKV